MFTKRIMAIGIAVLIAITAVGLAIVGAGLVPQQVQAQTTEENQTAERFVEVTGVGRVMAQPDTAVVRFGVETQDETASAALSANSEQMAEVISATLEAGVEEADIQTDVVRLQPIYTGTGERDQIAQSEPLTQTNELIGYRATNVLQVTTNDLENLGELLDTVVEAGSNRIENIQFRIDDQDALLVTAREQAVNNAQEQAEQLAELTGAELGAVRRIIDAGSSFPFPFGLETADVGGAVPIATGTQTIEVRVVVSWSLE